MVIGLAGRMRSGKDSVAQSLMKRYPNVQRVAFADKLKESAAACLGITLAQLEEFKISPRRWTLVEDLSEPLPSMTLDELRDYGEKQKALSFTTREFLQNYGAASHRDVFGVNFWVDAAFANVEDGPNKLITVTDCRYINEIEKIRSLDGVIVLVRRAEAEAVVSNHSSEQDLSAYADYEIDNNGTLEELDRNVDELMIKIQQGLSINKL